MQGTLIGLTHTGLNTEASLQAALFALETADQVLTLIDATPVQRPVLSVLTLEQFTEWLNRQPYEAVAGSLDKEDHPVCRYLQQHGATLTVSNLALYDDSGACVLGNDRVDPPAHELPLDLVGAWLPALLHWKTCDFDIGTDYATCTAREVLRFLELFQR